MLNCIYDCTLDREVFNAWVEQDLVPALRPGQVVVMDDAAFRKQQRTLGCIVPCCNGEEKVIEYEK
ncbi:MAG: transposase [Puniceicoccales bacterium]|nr:transposase [Puniceicoccales bacterium]